MATPATATSPRIALLLLSDWQQLALTILACQPTGTRAAPAPAWGVHGERRSHGSLTNELCFREGATSNEFIAPLPRLHTIYMCTVIRVEKLVNINPLFMKLHLRLRKISHGGIFNLRGYVI